MNNPIEQFKNAISMAGITPPEDIFDDGKLHRFSSNGNPNDNAGWYVYHSESIAAGAFGCWRTDIHETWKVNLGREYTPSEQGALSAKIAESKKLRDQEQARLHQEAKEKSKRQWVESTEVKEHPYLTNKKVRPYGIKQYKNTLLIPLWADDEIQSLQVINPDGNKRFAVGGKTQGCYFVIGELKSDSTACLCEGYATGASIHEATNYPVIIAFSANNLLAVAKTFQNQCGKIIVCADDDWKSTGNIGLTKAKAAAEAIKGYLALPTFLEPREDKQTDFNDMANLLGQSAVKRVIDDSIQTEWDEPIPLPMLPAVEPFNPEFLPISLRAFVMDVSELMQAPPDFAAVNLIVALSSLIGAKAVIQPKEYDDGWKVTPNLWGVLIGAPSSYKSPSFSKIQECFKELQSNEQTRFESEYQTYLAELQTFELMKKAIDKDALETFKDNRSQSSIHKVKEELQMHQPPKKPVLREFIVNDATVEKLGEILSGNPWGTLVFRDELIGLLKGLDKPGQDEARTFYLEAWDGNKPRVFNRIGRGRIAIPMICFSLLGTAQPDVFKDYFNSGIVGGSGNDGFLQRFGLAVYPDLGNFKMQDRAPNFQAIQQVKNLFKCLSELETENPRIWRFEKKAQSLFNQWYEELMMELRQGELHPSIQSHLMKYGKVVPALALIFSIVENPNSKQTIGEGQLLRAIAYSEYLRSHAMRIYHNATMPETKRASTILKRINDGSLGNGFTSRDINRKKWSGLTEIDQVKEALKLLVEYEYLRIESTNQKSKGGRPSQKYLINPLLLNGKNKF